MILPSQLLTEAIPPEQPLFRRREHIVKFAGFKRDVACLVAALQQSGGRKVVLHAEDNYDFAVGLFACLHAGVHTIIPGNLCENIRHRLQDEEVLFVHELSPLDEPATLEPVSASGVVVEFFTSGSTGTPKRIVRTLANLEAELQMLAEVLPDYTEVQEVFSTVRFYHAYGIIFGLLLPLSHGLLTDTAAFSGLEPWVSRVQALSTPGKLTWLVTTPAFLNVWAANTEQVPFCHRPVRLVSAGAPLSQAVANSISAATGSRILEIFGSSETGVAAYRYPQETSQWQPFRGVGLEIVPDDGMLIASPAVPVGTKAHLGDSAEMAEDGRFRLLPRVDRIVKLADKRVSLAEVEQSLNASSLVEQSCALVLPVQNIVRLAVAVVPSAEGCAILQEYGYARYKKELRRVLSRQIETGILPRKWRVTGELPHNAQGKVQHAAVRDLFARRLQLPVMFPVSKSDEKLEFRLLFVRDSSYLAGHFPGYPLVPGVVILQSLSSLVERYWGLRVVGIVRLKFAAETLPGHELTVLLTRKTGEVAVETRSVDGRKICQGRLRVEQGESTPVYAL